MKKQEEKDSLSLAKYMKAKKILYRYDVGADIRLTIGQSTKVKALQMADRGYPDLFIAEPKNNFHGLYIELKKNKSEVFLKDGVTYKKQKVAIKHRGKIVGHYDHIQEQVKMHDKLRKKGYKVEFGFGYKHCVEIIEDYLTLLKDIKEA